MAIENGENWKPIDPDKRGRYKSDGETAWTPIYRFVDEAGSNREVAQESMTNVLP